MSEPERSAVVSPDVLYKDGLILVLNKPAGLECTPAGKGPHLRLQDFTFGKTTLPQVAHRLDRDTSGCLVLGRHPRALRLLAELFRDRKVRKTYCAVVEGRWPEEVTQMDAPIEGKEAVTRVRLLRAERNRSWLELEPLTGRTHQLRIHCRQQGHPIAGDARYGARTGGRLLLHALRIEIPLSKNRAPTVVEAPLPANWPGTSDAAAEEVKPE